MRKLLAILGLSSAVAGSLALPLPAHAQFTLRQPPIDAEIVYQPPTYVLKLPDLIIESTRIQWPDTFVFRVKNIGTANAPATRTYVGIDRAAYAPSYGKPVHQGGYVYTPPLAVGQTVELWVRYPTTHLASYLFPGGIIYAYADARTWVFEGNERNNMSNITTFDPSGTPVRFEPGS